MKSVDFIKRIQTTVYESSINGILLLLEKPPGRHPSPNFVALSEWHDQLSVNEKERIREIVQLSVRAAVFGMLTVLDGVRSIRATEEKGGLLELWYTTETESVLLNDSRGELLHDLFAGEVPPL